MHNLNWQTFLETQGAKIENAVVNNFGAATSELIAAQNSNVLCDLSQFGLLKISGDDAQSFLHSLCSNDIKAITPAVAQFNSLNSAKGRTLATFLAWQNGSDYILQLPDTLLETIRKKLSMYVLRSKVKIENVSSQYVCIGLAGKAAETLLETKVGSVPQAVLAITHHAELSIIKIGQTRFQIITTAEQAASLWQLLCTQASPVGSACWDWLNIRAGIPSILPATQEQFVLQMLNLDLLGGVNFKKGCYPGQEIVARMHYLGKLKQRTYLAHLESEVSPEANDPLYSDDFAGQSSGSILNSAAAPQGGYDVLATLHINTLANSHPVHFKTPEGAILGFQDLPYSFS